jgi:hypothetical protein
VVPEAAARAVAVQAAEPEAEVLELVVVVPEAAARAVAAQAAEPEAEVLELVVVVPELGVREPEVVVLELAAVPEVVVPVVVQAPEVVPLAVVQVPGEPVLELAARAPEVVAPMLAGRVRLVPAVELPAVVRVRVAEAQVAPVPEAQVAPVAELRAPQVAQPRVPAEQERAAWPVQERQAWLAAEVEPLRPASAMAQRVPVRLEPSAEAQLAALARRVRSVPLQALPVSASRPAAAPRTGRRPMGPPRGHPARTEALAAGHGANSWRQLLQGRSRAPTSCAPCISAASSSTAPRTA